MLTDLHAEGFQSLHKVRVRLGKLTVITGPTSSGKSSLIRAARLVAFNGRGAGYITRGERKCVVGLGCQDEHWAASITRGERGADSYRVACPDPDNEDPDAPPKVWEYTKLAGKVPAEVAEVINLGELNFAGQFDAPFLLAETAGDVAKALGRLTGVTLVFAAAREAGRRRKALLADLAAAIREVGRLRAEAKRFATLKARLAAVQEAEQALERLREALDKAGAVQGFCGRLTAAQQALAQVVTPPEPPSLDTLEDLAARHAALVTLITTVQEQASRDGAWRVEASRQERVAEDAGQAVRRVLEKAGRCPLCGSDIHAEESHAIPVAR